jgi:hypothetical protein
MGLEFKLFSLLLVEDFFTWVTSKKAENCALFSSHKERDVTTLEAHLLLLTSPGLFFTT